jgi:hypothetical protein
VPADHDPVGGDLVPLAALVALQFERCHRRPRSRKQAAADARFRGPGGLPRQSELPTRDGVGSLR